MGTSRIPLLRTASLAVLIAAGGLALPLSAQALHPREYQLTMSPAHETRPAVGNDGISDLVTFTMQMQLPSGPLAPADVWYQRVGLTGPFGPSVQITADPTDDQYPDVSGDHLVYVSYDEVGLQRGRIVLYRISTRESWVIGQGDLLERPRIHGNIVVWVSANSSGGSYLLMYDLDWLGTPAEPLRVMGPIPTVSEVDVGSRFIVWREDWYGNYGVRGFDLEHYLSFNLSDSSTVDDMLPTTSGGWIVWMSQPHGGREASLLGIQPYSSTVRVIAEGTTFNVWPDVEGDLVAYASEEAADLDLYLYRLSTRRTYRITNHPAVDQKPPRIFGDKLVSYDGRNGRDDDVYVTVLDWAPVAHAGADRIVTERAWVTLDGSASLDENGEALQHAWSQTAGPPVVLEGADTASPGFLAPEVGRGGETLAFELVVTAGAYASDPDEVRALVQNLNHPPVAEAGEPQFAYEKGPRVLLDGTGCHDPDGDPIACLWIQVSGPWVTLAGASTPKAWFSPPRVHPPCEELRFQLVVFDGEAKAQDFTTVTVRSLRRVKVP